MLMPNTETIDHRFPVGCVVKLNSGGSRMTVTGHRPLGENETAWHDMGSPKTGVYPDAALCKPTNLFLNIVLGLMGGFMGGAVGALAVYLL